MGEVKTVMFHLWLLLIYTTNEASKHPHELKTKKPHQKQDRTAKEVVSQSLLQVYTMMSGILKMLSSVALEFNTYLILFFTNSIFINLKSILKPSTYFYSNDKEVNMFFFIFSLTSITQTARRDTQTLKLNHINDQKIYFLVPSELEDLGDLDLIRLG